MTKAASKAEEQLKASEEMRRKSEDAKLSFVRKLMNFAGVWKSCESRACRRARGCADARACRTKHAEEIHRFWREQYLPYLREHYPTVQWGAPASVMEPQLEAAFAAEEEEEARRAGRAPGTDAKPRARKPTRLPRQPAYDPGDW